MKYLIPVVLAAFVLVGCDKQKAAIDDSNTATKNAINNQKEAVDAAAPVEKPLAFPQPLGKRGKECVSHSAHEPCCCWKGGPTRTKE